MLKLERIDAGAFGTLPKLRDLYIQNNIRLKWIHPDVFEGIHVEDFELKNLHLSGNDLRYLPQVTNKETAVISY